jgi:DNA replication and repair protein RecF
LRTDYEKILRQRNTLLREEASDEDLSPWTHRLIEVGSSLVVHRRRLFSRIKEAMIKVYSELAQDGPLEATYLTSWERDAAVSGDVEPGEAMKRHLEIKRPAERARRSTISGPHRDDIEFRIAGREARAYASQGQQRTIALAWKLAEVSVTTDIASQRPLLLLDDVMSELDEERRHALAGFVGSVAQTVMTTTNLGYFERALLDRARVVIL